MWTVELTDDAYPRLKAQAQPGDILSAGHGPPTWPAHIGSLEEALRLARERIQTLETDLAAARADAQRWRAQYIQRKEAYHTEIARLATALNPPLVVCCASCLRMWPWMQTEGRMQPTPCPGCGCRVVRVP